ncbi:MAG: bifunctional 2-C-methyl-D-erythritol 4-phosphate cytidylyltransferase/2-C-methyl-D-erythritol 2,4-cyclodiphosphate synthase [Rhodospirillales bacterium]|nr:bifunctional 2-C-methyl-D-erythritol 4-phosphate cytidylyltransferase/2-C-methyl-D-erythritol 2,4-cyclodiphosphate synthase [Rhodospirillales bacterium]
MKVTSMTGCIALILSGGSGERFGNVLPKQYLDIGTQTIIRHAAEVFYNHPKIDNIRVVIRPQDKNIYQKSFDGFDILEPVEGGKTRQESVRFGLESLVELDPDIVLIHDGARPFPSHDLLTKTIETLEYMPAVIPVLRISETLKKVDQTGSLVKETIDRDNLFRAQTPQGFKFKSILEAHRKNSKQQFTDDAAIAEKEGLEIGTVSGEVENIKITTQEDYKLLVKMHYQLNGTIHVGTGFDVHPFSEGNHLVLCGVKIPYKQSLKGHSDSDVAIHAATDAILGAIGEDDIGKHFPSEDKKWKNTPSSIFLQHALFLVNELNGRVNNLDVTIICEKPKIGPYRKQMREKLSKILALPVTSVNVKATTTEKLGFTGREEGIAAQAIATVFLPIR